MKSKIAKIASAALGLAIFLSCADNPSLEFPSEEEVHQRYPNFSSTENSSSSLKTTVSSSSSTPGSSSLVPSSSSSSLPSSSSSVCAVADNTETHYCSNGAMKQYGSMTDDGGRTYKTIEISAPEQYQTLLGGPQIWMAENLSYNASGSICYDEQESNCGKYGRLYNWATAMALPSGCNSDDCSSQIDAKRHKGICPSGWHMPSKAEWTTLISMAGGGIYLKATSGWDPFQEQSGNGTDAYGFAALPGGMGDIDGNFTSAGTTSYWWHTSDSGTSSAAFLFMLNVNQLSTSIFFSSSGLKSCLFSVRCIKN